MAPHPFPTISDLARAKADLRAAALSRRDALDAWWRAESSRRVSDLASTLPELDEAATVAGFWPIRSEVDLRSLLATLHDRGKALALPVVTVPRLIFRSWTPTDTLASRGFGLSEPLDTAPEASPDVLLVPLACFDRRGGRVGYGKGHYDRALSALRARDATVAIGLAFATQEVASVPVDDHDEPLDLVVTEKEIIRVGGRS